MSGIERRLNQLEKKAPNGMPHEERLARLGQPMGRPALTETEREVFRAKCRAPRSCRG